jgi:3-oxoacyl-[acyl-carrier protein] reductase
MMAEAGAQVVANYCNNERAAQETQAEIERRSGTCYVEKADVSDLGQVTQMIQRVASRLGTIDILVNNAGIWTYGEIDAMSPEVWRKTMQVNLDGVFYCCRQTVPVMKAHGGGRIINLSSTAGQRGEAFHSHYAATKGAIISLTKSLAAELALHNILVNCVAPGWVDTDMSAEPLEQEKDKILPTIPLGRAGKAEEIAGAILFLASDLATYVNGEVINVNGGSVLCG